MICAIIILFPTFVVGQSLREDTRVTISLSTGVNVTLFAAGDCRNCFYYVPAALRLSRKADRTPEISLVTWNDDLDQVTGGILHFLVRWGLEAEEELELLARIREDHDSLAVIMGPASVTTPGRAVFGGDDALATILKTCLTSSSGAATTPGSAMAFSFRFGRDEIKRFLESLSDLSRTTSSLRIAYAYLLTRPSGQRVDRETTLSLPLSEILKYVKK